MKILFNSLKNILYPKQYPNQLGRWMLVPKDGKESCQKSLEVIIRQANMDNCGDRLCGIPKYIKNTSLKK